MRYAVILGTRPEIIKMAPVLRELSARNLETAIIHTNQHYSANMDEIFWRSLDIPRPTHRLEGRASGHSAQVAEMLSHIGSTLERLKPDWVLVHGDTNSTLAGALAASKMPGVRLAHVEAGLRSFDRTMPEEINRVVVDHLSQLLFAPTANSVGNLEAEGFHHGRIRLVGNTIEDAVRSHLGRASEIELAGLGVPHGESGEALPYAVLTLHRQENTADLTRFKTVLNSVFAATARAGLTAVFPIHPRTKALLDSSGLRAPKHVLMIEPLGYFEFLSLLARSALVVTDSGGLQEEACLLGKPCVTLRENTERPETVALGANCLAGTTVEGIHRAIRLMANARGPWLSPYGNGLAARRIVDELESSIVDELESASNRSRSTGDAKLDARDKNLGVLGVQANPAAASF